MHRLPVVSSRSTQPPWKLPDWSIRIRWEPGGSSRSRLATLPKDFASRHIGPSDPDITAMLDIVGAPSVEALIGQALPDSIRFPGMLEVGAALSESDALAHLKSLAAKNQ